MAHYLDHELSEIIGFFVSRTCQDDILFATVPRSSEGLVLGLAISTMHLILFHHTSFPKIITYFLGGISLQGPDSPMPMFYLEWANDFQAGCTTSDSSVNYHTGLDFRVPVSPIQTPTPRTTANANGNFNSDTAAVSRFGTSCCGWGSLFDWSATGKSDATISRNCDAGLPLSVLNLNGCISWTPRTGFLSCSTTFVSLLSVIAHVNYFFTEADFCPTLQQVVGSSALLVYGVRISMSQHSICETDDIYNTLCQLFFSLEVIRNNRWYSWLASAESYYPSSVLSLKLLRLSDAALYTLSQSRQTLSLLYTKPAVKFHFRKSSVSSWSSAAQRKCCRR